MMWSCCLFIPKALSEPVILNKLQLHTFLLFRSFGGVGKALNINMSELKLAIILLVSMFISLSCEGRRSITHQEPQPRFISEAHRDSVYIFNKNYQKIPSVLEKMSIDDQMSYIETDHSLSRYDKDLHKLRFLRIYFKKNGYTFDDLDRAEDLIKGAKELIDLGWYPLPNE